jgi:hypothetical protein
VKLINKFFLFLSLVSLGLSSLEAKSIDILLDHKTKETFDLQAEIPEQRQEQSLTQTSLLSYLLIIVPLTSC